jgi:hypothetical protein
MPETHPTHVVAKRLLSALSALTGPNTSVRLWDALIARGHYSHGPHTALTQR